MTVEIWKFDLQPFNNKVMMPTHARVLSVGFQGEGLRVWAVVVPSNVQKPRIFEVIGTGWQADGKACGPFIGTVFHPGGLVFHVFDHGYEGSEISSTQSGGEA